ncbi:hypothetical protein [Parvularcula sp. LCG005]|uniref:hypothetical protein n=1 Tax=Parvularcula sp. LCG005 TaxID=3078805 RepID=UPI002943AC07|nr:hypothetical protein [Parvularcula sp. LCG005]WOI54095.1 hypothetical protein RUI03_03615 [Parvularcula sp. LCG005]
MLRRAFVLAKQGANPVDWPLMISVLIFAALNTCLWLFSLSSMPACRLAFTWVSGWHSHVSLIHMTGYALVGLVLWWGISTCRVRNWTNALVALLLFAILAISFWSLLALKSVLIPYSTPTMAQMQQTIPPFMRANYFYIDESEYQQIPVSYDDWTYPFPPPPDLLIHPKTSRDLNPKNFEIFGAPIPAPIEIETARQCAIAYDAAEDAYWQVQEARWMWFKRFGHRVSEEDRRRYRLYY